MTTRRAMLLMGIESPDLADLALRAGVEVVVLDYEHGFSRDGRVRAMVAACRAAGGRCFVRLAPGDVARTSLLADVGIDGVVLSGVRSLRDIEAACKRATFPPDGSRSVNPFVPSAGRPGDETELRRSAAQFEIWAMAETRDFLAEMSAAAGGTPAADGLSMPGWRGMILGPYDLSAELACRNSPSDKTLLPAARLLSDAASARNVEFGMFSRDEGTLADWDGAGIRPGWVMIGYDRDIWYRECQRRVDALSQLATTGTGGRTA